MPPLDLPTQVYRGEDGRWHKPCPECNEYQSYLRKNYAISSFLEKKACKKCSNSKPENCVHKGWVKGVLRRSFANKYQKSAVLRNIEWDLTFEYLADLLIEQDFKCALTDWDIDAMDANKNTASLDRIDSSLGYVEGNVQWVHKMVNMCKQGYSQEEFLSMCRAVNESIKP
jgi:hypothetical protein